MIGRVSLHGWRHNICCALCRHFIVTFNKINLMDLLQALEIPARPLAEMSKGQRQKLKLAATISRKSDLYLLDEPLAGIDPACP